MRGAEGPWGSRQGRGRQLAGGPGAFGGGRGHPAKCPPLSLSALQLPELVVLCHLLLPGEMGHHHPPFKFLLLWSADRVGPGCLDDITEQVGL